MDIETDKPTAPETIVLDLTYPNRVNDGIKYRVKRRQDLPDFKACGNNEELDRQRWQGNGIGSTIAEAVGAWAIRNQDELGFKVEVIDDRGY
jgi:hypothetical protein